MSESVEQAALRRAAHDDLPAPFGAIMQAIAAAGDLCDARHRQTAMLVEQIDALHAENAELRDGMLALSNRLEAVTRTVIRHPGMEVTEPLVMWTEP